MCRTGCLIVLRLQQSIRCRSGIVLNEGLVRLLICLPRQPMIQSFLEAKKVNMACLNYLVAGDCRDYFGRPPGFSVAFRHHRLRDENVKQSFFGKESARSRLRLT